RLCSSCQSSPGVGTPVLLHASSRQGSGSGRPTPFHAHVAQLDEHEISTLCDAGSSPVVSSNSYRTVPRPPGTDRRRATSFHRRTIAGREPQGFGYLVILGSTPSHPQGWNPIPLLRSLPAIARPRNRPQQSGEAP